MVAIKSLIFSALFATAALAQEPSNNFTSAQIAALAAGSTKNSPTASEKVSWCVGQMSLCGTLCSGDNSNNQCNSTSLQFTCLCSNSSTPPLQYYPFSIVGLECSALQADCIAANPNDQAGQSNCQTEFVCGNATHADAVNAANAAKSGSSSSSSASPSGSATPSSSSNTATSSTPSASPTHNAAPAYKAYGPGALAMGVLAIVAVAM